MSKPNNRFALWGGAAAAIALSVFVVVSGSAPDAPTGDVLTTTEITAEDWTKGNPDAKVTLIEYSDFQCPACSNMYYVLDGIMKEFGNHITFAYRHFPLRSIHDKTDISGQAANAAGYQDKFFEMHDLIFQTQQEWENQTPEEAEATFIGFAESLGLDMEKFIEDLNSSENKQSMDDAYDHALEIGITGTPSIFLNGEKLAVPRNVDEFRELIRNAIENA